MYSLEIIIARNQTPAEQERRLTIAAIHGEVPAAQAAKQASRDEHFDTLREHYGQTLADEAREVIEVYGDAPRLTAAERLLVRFATEILSAGIDGLPEVRVRQ